MPAIAFRPPVLAKLHRIGAGDIPPGEFRVTRSFNDLSFPQHGAHDGIDIGNGRAHDPIVAIAPGVVIEAGFRLDAGGAAIVRIDHGGGWTSGYAHMDRIDVTVGQLVSEGTQIGTLGSTGWVTGAHLHFDITHNGVRQDPWPLLKLEEDMRLPTALSSIVYGTLGAGNNIRKDPSTTEGARVTDKVERVQVFGQVSDAKWTIGNQSGDTWYFIGLGLDAGFVATALIPTLELTKLGTDLLPPSQGIKPESWTALQNQAVASLKNIGVRANADADALAAKKP